MEYIEPADGIGVGISLSSYSQSLIGSATNTPLATPFRFSVVSAMGSGEYCEYEINYSGGGQDWLSLTGTGIVGSTVPLSPGRQLLPVLDNIAALTPGNHAADINFMLKDGNGFVLDMASHTVFLSVENTGPQVSTDKSVYNLVYNRASNTLTGDTLITINNNSSTVDFVPVGNVFQRQNGLVSSFTLAEWSAYPLASNPELPPTGVKVIEASLFRGTTRVASFSIRITVVASNDLVVSPTALTFDLMKSANETKSAVLQVVNPGSKAFTVTKPAWLNLSAASGSGSANITVTTQPSGGLAPGDYSGDIVFNCDGKSTVVSVTMRVITFMSSNINEAVNFCLDGKTLDFYRITQNGRYVRLSISAQFRTAEGTTTVTVPMQMPYFRDKVSFDLGEKINWYFRRISRSLFGPLNPASLNNALAYYPASVSVTADEVDVEYNVLFTEKLEGIKLYPGKKPKGFPLLTNHLRRRRYQGSVYFFSYIYGQVGQFTDVAVGYNSLEAEAVTMLRLEDAEGKINWSPEKTLSFGPAQLSLKEYPRPHILTHLQWENQNLVPEWLTLAGEFKMENEYGPIYKKDVFTRKNKKFGSTAARTITINTGFLLAEERALITELMDSRVCFISRLGEVYECFPVQTKLVSEDSTQQLVQFELEFLTAE